MSNLKKNAIIYLLSDLFSRGLPFLLTPYLFRSLGSSDFANLSLQLAFIATTQVLITYGGEKLIVRYFFRYSRDGVLRLMFLLLKVNFTITIITFLLLNIFSEQEYIIALLCSLTFSVLGLFASLQNCKGRGLSTSLIKLVPIVISTIITILCFEFYQATYTIRIQMILISNCIVMLFCFSFFKKNIQRRRLLWEKKMNKFIIFGGGSFLITNFTFVMKGQVDRFFIYEKFGADLLSVYALAYQYAGVISVVSLALSRALMPTLQTQIKSKKIEQKHSLLVLLVTALLSVIVFIFFYYLPNSVYTFIFGESVTDFGFILSIFSVSNILTLCYIIPSNILVHKGLTARLASYNWLSIALYFSLVYLFSFYGIRYIPFAMLLSNLFLSVIYCFDKVIYEKY
ncbi:oligosaccharide flippase family protein [Vibrio sp. MA40-2]|uniref:oligosaccharide flippase family protein n=1 Tax=Vibrio sp. MA40-2 TaxID=3391828 RepID=UPI0039A44F99